MIGEAVLQKAIYAALNGMTVGGTAVGVYDELPTTTLTRYVVIGETAVSRPWDTHDSEGSESFPTIHAWSKAKGSREVQLIMEEIDARLHNVKLVLDTGSTVLLQRDFSQVLREEVNTGETWRHGVMRYRALITQ